MNASYLTHSHRLRRRITVLLSVVALTVGVVVPAAAARPAAPGAMASGHTQKVGTTSMRGARASAVAAGDSELEFQPDPEEEAANRQISGSKSSAHVPSKHVPRPATSSVQEGTATGFDGLNHFDNRSADGGNKFSLEPPDQALCVSDTQVLESVNTVLRVRDKSGADLSGVIAINPFFGLAPEIIRSNPPVFGPFSSDPKCYFDASDGGHWFVTILSADIDPATGAFTGPTSVLIAVSDGPNAATATWNIYKQDTTNDGEVGGNCPCLGDQPLIGADANGFYVTTNVFPLFGPGFNGAMVYGFSKADLESGAPTPTMVKQFEPTLAEGYAYSIQPATSPNSLYEDENGGTEYLLSALDFWGATDNRIAVWAMTNTSSLDTATPEVTLSNAVLGSITYGQPPAVLQKDGDTPLLDASPAKEHLNLLNSNDDRMNQTVYVNGQIWGAVNTVVKSPTGPSRTGIAYFIVAPSGSGATFSGTIAKQGYISVDGNSVMFPAVAVNADSQGIIGFSLAGPDYYPSAAYVEVDATHGAGPVNIAATGAGPADGFTGYLSQAGGNGVERWGDYSAAVADPAGDLWFATEYIGQSCTFAEFVGDTTCGGTRTFYANWGTYIAKVTP